MVAMESVVSGHRFNIIRERLGDKLEAIRFDPMSEYQLFYNLLFNFTCMFRAELCNAFCLSN